MNRTSAVTLPVLGSILAALIAVGVPVGIAHAQTSDIAKPPGITVDRHARVVLSVLPTCRNEDGPNRHGACTWNVGPLFHRSDELSLYYRPVKAHDLTADGNDFRPHYVWNRDPVKGHPYRDWLTTQMRAEFRAHAEHNRHRPWNRCYVQWGETDHVICPNGDRYSAS